MTVDLVEPAAMSTHICQKLVKQAFQFWQFTQVDLITIPPVEHVAFAVL